VPSSATNYDEACTLELTCDMQAVAGLCRTARDIFAHAGLTVAEIDAWELALSEAAGNAVRYCRPEASDLAIRVDLLLSRDRVEVRVNDHTAGFDWPVEAELPPDDSESGRGIFLIQNLTDESRYLRGRGENCLVLRKRRSPLLEAAPHDPAEELRDARHTLDLMTEELASSYESLSAIFRFTGELQGGVNAEEFIPRWLGELLVITEADWFVLRLVDDASRRLRVAATSVPDWSDGTGALEAAQGRAESAETQAVSRRSDVWFDSAMPLAPGDPLAGPARSGCGLAHPLFAKDALVGVLSIGRHDALRPFQSGQVNVIQTFGDFLGLQIRNTQLQEGQLRARVNTRDLEIASNLQRALLPERLPSVARATLSGYYRSAREIGGDYYDALPVGDDDMLLVVADVMGKGLPAALFAFMFRSLVRARRELASRPGEFLAWLNQNLFQELDRAEMFITAQLAFLDSATGEIRVASAGHPPMLVASPEGLVTEIPASGPPLGILADAVFDETCLDYTVGRALLFTDGLIEARDPDGDLLGLDAIKSQIAMAALSGESSEATHRRLVSLLQTFEAGATPADDTAFIVIVIVGKEAHGDA
jgi:serine phosphatase RsbU (regulator of sigma subunit)/anti-sigma regulatory factor (Ser/Thr protein kinase)